MTDREKTPNAWLIVLDEEAGASEFWVEVGGLPAEHGAIRDGDGVILARRSSRGLLVEGFARAYRVRRTTDAAMVYFDGTARLSPARNLASLGVATADDVPPVSRVDWEVFESALKAGGTDFGRMPVINGSSPREQAYIRELLQLAVTDDLLGPASGQQEEIVGMSVRDRYLVGKLAPRTAGDENIEGLKGPAALDDDVPDGEVPSDLRPLEEVGTGRDKGARRLVPGEEFASTAGSSDPDDDESQEIEASKNQSVVPSSLGLTVCVDGSAEALEAEVRWGRYVRGSSEEQVDENGKPLRAWKRVPSGGD